MRRLAYIVLMTLLVAVQTAAGQSYVIDKVCQGAERTYRIDGETGSSWVWKLEAADGTQIVLADSTGTDFADVNTAGDSIRGSEIFIKWEVEPGIYSLSTEQTSIHGCVNHELGEVEVVPVALSDAGENIIACSGSAVPLNDATAINYSTLLWETNGDGTFDNPTTLNPIYTPGANDLTAGTVNLTLTANGEGNPGSCDAAISTVTITFSNPEVQLTGNNLLCYQNNSGEITASVSGGIEPYTFIWTGPGGFTATGAKISGLAAGQYIVTVTDSFGCSANQSVTITEPDDLVLTETHVDVGYSPFPIGEIDLTVTGGTEPYTFLWSNGETTEDLDQLAAGTYTVIVTDANGCLDSLTVVIVSLDPEITLSCLPIQLQCIGEVALPYASYTEYMAEGGSAFSHCIIDPTTFRFVSDSTAGVACSDTIFRTYEVLDYCGNITSCTQLISIKDTIPPAITCPADIVAQCAADVPAPDLTSVVASDNCGAVVVEWVSDISDNNSCPTTISRTYRATDICNNSSECIQTITINDTIPPAITCPADIVAQCAADVPAPDLTSVVASDNCGAVVVEWVSDISDNNLCPTTISRTYRATDICNNSSECIQTININDTIPPAITCPADIVAQCAADVPAPDTSSVVASDNCGAVVVEWVSDISDNNSCPETITRIYRATDGCGNESTCAQQIIINDIISPAITCPADIVAQCAADVPAPDTSSVVASDNCGAVVVEWVSDVSDNNSCPETITRIYRATDGCGNFKECSQQIIIDDIILPTITCPADIVAQCAADVPAPDLTSVVASDNCGAVVVEWVSDVSDNNSCPETITRIYRATDDCGNFKECSQQIIINDTIPPVFNNMPGADKDITCLDQLEPAENLTASDNCGNTVVTFSIDPYSADQCSGFTVIYRWRAVDDCGNDTEVTRNFNILPDTIPPGFTSEPISINDIRCNDPLPTPEVLYATDNCGNATVLASADPYSMNICTGYPVTYRWTATDNCGNTAVKTRTFNVLPDTIPPAFNKLPDPIADILCESQMPEFEELAASDNCSPVTVTETIDPYSSDKCNGYTITYRWTATDNCGNSSKATQNFNVLPDNLAPVFDNPVLPELTILCSEPLPVQANLSATDNCGNVAIITSTDPYTEDLCNGNEIVYRWRATDECGNFTDTTQTIRILPDTSIPVFDKNPNPIADIQCSDPLPVPETITASDDCGNTTVVHSTNPYVVDLCNGYPITYRWSVTDGCGNHSEISQSFNVLPDTTGPVFDSAPANIPDITCADELPVQEVLTAGDNCGSVTVIPSVDAYTVDKCNGYTITYRWSATDECGNSTVVTKPFNVLPDQVLPVFELLPSEIANITCTDSLPALEILTATDNCGTASVVSSIDPYVVDKCVGYPITYRWVASDECGNYSEIARSFNVLPDTIRPVFDLLPGADLWIDCPDSLPVQEILTASDNCGLAIVTPSIDPYTEDICNGFVITYRWTASDECGNTTVVTREISVQDTIQPTADPLPELGPFACFDEIPAPDTNEVTGESDNCSNTIIVTHLNDSEDPGCEGIVYRTYMVEDECGNSAGVVQIIHIKDTIPPTADSIPSMGPLACFADIPAPDFSIITGAADNCSDSVYVSFGGDSAGSGCSGNVVRTYLLDDGCGNILELFQTILVNDTVPPIADSLPDIGPFACYSKIPPFNTDDVTGETDNCGGNVTVSFVGDSEDPGCEGIVARTYRISDDCNNRIEITQHISIRDTIAPVADPLPNLGSYACYSEIPAPTIEEVTGEADNCGKPVLVEIVGDSEDPGCEGTVTRIYRISDTCGNADSLLQYIFISDTVPPTADPLPELGPYTCYSEIPAANVENVTGEADNCGDAVLVEFVSDSEDPGCEGTVTRIYRISDNCGNADSLFQSISIKDTIAPVADQLPDLGPFACYSEIPTYNTSQITGIADNCSDSTSVEFVSDSGDPGCEGTVLRIYRVWDDCGNFIELTQLIGIKDTIAPTADSLPTIGPIMCYEDRPAPNVEDVAGEADNCSNTVLVEFVSDSGDPGCEGLVTRIYRISDSCGNTDSLFQSILINDTIGPVFTQVPSDYTVTCEADLPYQNYAEFVAAGGLTTDNCHPETSSFKFIGDSTTTGDCPRQVFRTYRIWDDCDNSTDFIQIITIVDNLSPIINCPPPKNVFPFMITPNRYDFYSQFIEAGGFTDDNCGIDTTFFQLINEITDGNINPEKVTRTYQIKDYCGNTSTCDHIIYKYTGFDFVVICPVDLFIDCADTIPAPFASYADFVNNGGYAGSEICGVDTSSLRFIYLEESDSCPKIITRVYELSDTCENKKFCTHQIIINDLLAPELYCPPTLTIAEGSAVPPAFATYLAFEAAGGFASDNCELDYASFVLLSEESDLQLFPETITRTYQISDWCGNTGTCEQKIIYKHPSELTISCPDIISVECFDDVPAIFRSLDEFRNAGGIVAGNCEINESSFILTTEIKSATHCPDTLFRTYEVADTCGTIVSCVHRIVIDDNTPPEIACPPIIRITVGGNVPLPFATFDRFIVGLGVATDNCLLDSASFRLVSNISDNQLYPETFTRTYEIADMCGNAVLCEHQITLMHEADQNLICPPVVRVECIGNLPLPFADYTEFRNAGGEATSTCGIDITTFRFVSDSSDNKKCPEIIFRAYQIADSCGNILECNQGIIVDDLTPPELACPGDTVLPFNVPLQAAFTTLTEFIEAGGSAFDNCGLDSTSFRLVLQETLVAGPPAIVRRTYEVADLCGRIVSCDMQITVSGDAQVVLACPGIIEVECLGYVPAPYSNFTGFEADGGQAFSKCGIDKNTFTLLTESSNGEKCPEIISRVYNVLDSCGNGATCTHQIIVEDRTNPDLICTGDVVVQTLAQKPAAFTNLSQFITSGGLADDNCGLVEESFQLLSEVSNGKINPEILTRTYEIADSCGNTGICSQKITIVGEAVIQISCPPTIYVSCPGNLPAPYPTLAAFEANGGKVSSSCAIIPTSFRLLGGDVSNGNTCPEVISRTYEIKDDCGNTETCTQQIIINDTNPPTLGYQPKALVVDCEVPPPFQSYNEFMDAGGIFNDNCGVDESSFRFDMEITTKVSACSRYIDRYYIIEDLCGNEANYIHRITVEDKTPPFFVNVPGDITTECEVPQPYPNYNSFVTAGGLASDNCFLSVSSFRFVSDQVVETSCPRVINRTYQISDSCGLVSTYTQKITGNDTIPPQFTCPAALNVTAAEGLPPALNTLAEFTLAGGSASDNCGLSPSSFTLVSEIITSPYCPRIITRTYRVADLCGTISECSQTITITENELPEFTCPPDIFAECRDELPEPFNNYTEFIAGGGALSSDENMDLVSFRLKSGISAGLCPERITRVYEITDICGTPITCTQIITINDTVPPVLNCPDTITVYPGQPLPVAFAGADDFINSGGVISDNCLVDSASFVLVSQTSTVNYPFEYISRNYRVLDQCGNPAQCTHVVKRIQVAGFELSCPEPLTVECKSEVPPAFATVAEFRDAGGEIISNCGIDEQSFTLYSEVSDHKSCPEKITRSYQIKDNCGNQAVCQQVITIHDKIAPVVTCPETVFAQCNSEIPVPDISIVVATDNCGLPTVAFVKDSSDFKSCPETITRIYKAEDECGNFTLCNQLFIIYDTILPVITRCPAQVDVQCYDDIPEPDTTRVKATDNCGSITIKFVSDVSDGNRCPERITRTYVASDNCGNSQACTQIITIDDKIPPTISCPGDTIIGVYDTVPAIAKNLGTYILQGGSVSDNCAIDTGSFRMVVETKRINPCDYTLDRIYEIADKCGNIRRCSQSITVVSGIPPQMACPANLTVECTEEIPEVYSTLAQFRLAGGVASSTRVINESSFRLVSEISDGNTCPEIITRAYEIADVCGTLISCEQIITIHDTTLPIISCPAPLILYPSETVPGDFANIEEFVAAGGIVSENCKLDSSRFRLVAKDTATNHAVQTITNTYEISDGCGNIARCDYTMVVVTDAETQISCPATIHIECYGELPDIYHSLAEFELEGGTASSNCGLNTGSFHLVSESSDNLICPETITRTYEVTDLCNNTLICTQYIVTHDTIPPQFVNVPGDIQSVCEIPVPYKNFTEFVEAGGLVTDNCQLDTASFELAADSVVNASCPKEIIRTYRISDMCGNTSEIRQSVVVSDNTLPEFTKVPQNINTECSAAEAYNSYSAFIAAGGEATDNCGLDTARFRLANVEFSSSSCPMIMTRTYEISDICGNLTQFEQVVTVSDLIGPVFVTVPGDLFSDCSVAAVYSGYSEFRNAGGLITDNCMLDTSSFRLANVEISSSSCPIIMTRTYEISDICGNKTEYKQTVTVDDSAKPVFVTVPGDLFSDCSIPDVYSGYSEFRDGGGLITDNCALDTASFRLANVEFSSSSCPMIMTRTYEISDICGNKAEYKQTVTVEDSTKPVFVTVPGDLFSDCSTPEPYSDYAGFINAGGNISDNCGINESSFILVSENTENDICPKVIVRTYHIEDLCGNYTDYSQRVVVHDTVAPVIIKAPGDILAECVIPASMASFDSYLSSGAIITDNCGIDETSFMLVSELKSGSCPAVITRIYRISDLCGNSVELLHTIIAFDNTPPVILCPGTINIQPEETRPLSFTNIGAFVSAGGFISDNCAIDSSSFRLLSETSDQNSCPETIARIYEISDSCNNRSYCTQLIILHDTTAPVIISPKHVVEECIAQVPAPYSSVGEFRSAGGIISDNWGIVETSFRLVSEVDDGKTCPKLITRTYEVADSCGARSSSIHYITVSDLTDPVIICPKPDTVLCYENIPLPFASLSSFIAGGGVVTDNCGYVAESFSLVSETMSSVIPKTMTRTYLIADSCNNTATCNHLFTVLDTIPPLAVCNQIEVTLDSMGNLTMGRIDLLTIGTGSFDNCTDFLKLTFDLIPNHVNCKDIGVPVIVTLEVGDEVGNTSICTTTVIVRDQTWPVAKCKDIEVYLDENGNAGITKEEIDNNSYDNCGIRSMFINRNRFDCDDIGDNTVELTVIDNFANISTCNSKVTVLDTVAPEVFCHDLILEIGENDSTTITVMDVDAGSRDACGIDSMWLSRYQFTCADTGDTTVTLLANDVNGNLAECTAHIRIIGNQAPVANDDKIFTVVDTPVDINILDNDYDNNGAIDSSSIILINTLQHGRVTSDSLPGLLTYIPDSGFIGYDTLIYTICDDGLPCGILCDTAYVIFIVTPPNAGPIAVADSFVAGCLEIRESFILNDYDPDGNPLAARTTPLLFPEHGTVTINSDGSFIYKHEPGFIGVDSFVYEICDNGEMELCASATVKITVQIDRDCDGVPDINDIDDDDDGILDVAEGDMSVDTDGDGFPDSIDIDSDNDGIADNVEGQGEAAGVYILPAGSDSNGNGWDDAYDPGSGGYQFIPADTDDDGIPDFRDLDSDGDHVPDNTEGHDKNADGFADIVKLNQDRDLDGLDDAYDSYDRISGNLNTQNAIGSNAPLQDFDNDGYRDWRDLDDDNDGIYTVDEDVNRDGDYANDDVDLDGHPEYLDLDNECELFVPEGFSPNGDGVHDNFKIYCMEGYLNAVLHIYDREGHELYRHEYYGNIEYWGSEDRAWWDGSSESRWVRTSGILPQGNYIYVLILDKNRQEKGTVMISY